MTSDIGDGGDNSDGGDDSGGGGGGGRSDDRCSCGVAYNGDDRGDRQC